MASRIEFSTTTDSFDSPATALTATTTTTTLVPRRKNKISPIASSSSSCAIPKLGSFRTGLHVQRGSNNLLNEPSNVYHVLSVSSTSQFRSNLYCREHMPHYVSTSIDPFMVPEVAKYKDLVQATSSGLIVKGCKTCDIKQGPHSSSNMSNMLA